MFFDLDPYTIADVMDRAIIFLTITLAVLSAITVGV